MGQGYTIGGDQHAQLDYGHWSAQSFRPDTDFTLHYIDLYIKRLGSLNIGAVTIRLAGGDHAPFGDDLSRDIRELSRTSLPDNITLIRYEMESRVLLKDEYYAILLRGRQVLPGPTAGWVFDQGDATYPRGIRTYSTDSGATWTPYNNDDHLFSVWGTPHAPPPPPGPSPSHWALMDLKQEQIEGGFNITAYTESPCHLTLLWTLYVPWTHRTSTTRRGLKTLDFAYWCYVSWHEIEQQEEGDTEIHTFFLPFEYSCQTKWFRFNGTIAGADTPSQTPIFEKHYWWLPPTFITIGAEAESDRGAPGTWTYVSDLHPAEADGIIRKITIYPWALPLENPRVGIFSEPSEGVFTTRSWVDLATINTPGINIITTDYLGNPLALEAKAGDKIGIYWDAGPWGTGRVACEYYLQPGGWIDITGNVIPCTDRAFTWHVPYGDLYLIGTTQ